MPSLLQARDAEQQLPALLASAINKEIESQIDAAVKVAQAEVERRIRSEIGRIAANVLTRFSYEMRGEELVIRVDFKNTQQ